MAVYYRNISKSKVGISASEEQHLNKLLSYDTLKFSELDQLIDLLIRERKEIKRQLADMRG